jgi:citrate lyase subunit beta/citryl-CoA lyase
MRSLRRSFHFVPGINERMFNKSLTLAADVLILDLEDSVSAELKAQARTQVCDWLREGDFGGREKLVRVNPLDSPWGREDLEAVTQCIPDGIVVPKVSDAGDVKAIDSLLTGHELQHDLAPGSMSLLVIATETPAAVLNLSQMLQHPRVDGAAWGAEDLAAELGARTKYDEYGNYLEVFTFARSMCLLSAVAADVQAIDAPFVDIKDAEGLMRECRLTASMGFTGKLTIHPSQIDIVNTAFLPSSEEVERAQELLAAFEKSQQEGRVAFTFNGEMVDVPHLKKARKIVERAGMARERK